MENRKKHIIFIYLLVFISILSSCGVNMDINKHGSNDVEQTIAEVEFNSMIENPSNFPVSFVYGNKYYNGFDEFKVEEIKDTIKGEKREVIIDLLHNDDLLKVSLKSAFYKKYDAYEWTIYFTNIGKKNTPILSDVSAADIYFKGDNPVIKGNYGDYGGYFTHFEKNLKEGALEFDANHGRSCSQWMPYFNVETDNGGAMIAIGWPGTWNAKFEYTDKGTNFKGNGTTAFATYLKPNETYRTALMAFVRYFERDYDVATNKWRRWYIDCNMPYEDNAQTKKMSSIATVSFLSDTPFGWYRGGSEFENQNTWKKSVEAVKKHNLKFDYHWFDAGWYVSTSGQSLNDSWWDVGSWDLDETKWPGDTFKEYTTALKEDLGVKGSTMWFELERFTGPVKDFLTRHPEYNTNWLIPCDNESYLVDHSSKDCRDWLFSQVTKVMDRAGIDIFREDHNFDLKAAFKAGDYLRGNRPGITENLHFQGKFELWDRILEWQLKTGRPAFLEMQSSGGNRQDLELLRRSISFFRSDSDIVLDSPFTISKINSLNKWIPFGGVLFGKVVETSDTNPRDKFQWRSAYSSNLCVPLQYQKLNDDTWRLLEWGLNEYNKYKPYVFYDFYELTPTKPLYDNKQWVSRMYFDSVQDKGVLETFTFVNTTETVKTIKLKGVNPDHWYRLIDEDGANGATRVKGSELLKGYDIYLNSRTSSIIWIEPLNSKGE